MNLKNKKILLTGGAGFLGQAVYRKLIKRGVDSCNIFVPDSSDCDLRKGTICRFCVKDTDVVIHLAGKIGGISFWEESPGQAFYDNLIMGVQLMEEARKANVEKFVIIGTSCSYPKHASVPFREEDLWEGYPNATVAPYALAKLALLVQAQAYRKQYDLNAVYLVLSNFYGPGADLDAPFLHVIPSLIGRILKAKRDKKEFIEVWGSGRAIRDFLFVEDVAEGVLLATEKYDQPGPINIGSGVGTSIRDLVELLVKLLDFDGEIRWDTTKQEGALLAYLDTSRAFEKFGFKAKTSLVEGLEKTINWFCKEKGLLIGGRR